MRTREYGGIDYFRLVAALMVIAIHVAPFAAWNKTADYLITCCLGRVAVPFFFMTTGYFTLAPYIHSGGQRKKPVLRFIVKNLLLYITVTLCYLPLTIYSNNLPKGAAEWIKWLAFDGTFYHLWYFPAAIIGCTLLMYLTKPSIYVALAFSIPAYIIGVMGDSWYGVIKSYPIPHALYDGIFTISSYTRNGLFFAPIFLLTGALLAYTKYHCSYRTCYIGLIISLPCMLLEGFFTYSLKLQQHNSMYFFLLPVMYFLFQLLLRERSKAPGWIRKSSMLVYIIHPAVIILLRGFAKAVKLTNILIDNNFVQYLCVCTISFGIVCLGLYLSEKRKQYHSRPANAEDF